MKIKEVDGKPWRSFISILPEDGSVSPSQIITSARSAKIVDEENRGCPIIWIAFGSDTPTAWCVQRLMEYGDVGAQASAQQGFHIPNAPELLAA